MRLHRWLCQRQRLGDLSVREALRDKLEHLAFALSQVPEPLGAQFVCWNGETRKAVQQAARHRRRDKRFARGDDANGLDEFSGSDILQQKPAGAGAECLDNMLVRVERREDQDPPPRVTIGSARDASSGLHAVHDRHPHVHDDDVRVHFEPDARSASWPLAASPTTSIPSSSARIMRNPVRTSS